MLILDHQNQINEVTRLRDEEGWTFDRIGSRFGFSERTARRRYEAGILARAVDSLQEIETLDGFPDMPKLPVKKVGKYLEDTQTSIDRLSPLEVYGDAIITCDFHIPLHDPQLINVLINASDAYGIDQLVIAGDFYNMDQLSSYLPHQPEASLDIEKSEGLYVMKTLLKTFNKVYFSWGNHDFRLTKKLGYKESFTACMKWMLDDLTSTELDKITFTDLDYLHYYPGAPNNFWRICHPRNFSSVPLTVARKMAQKYDCNVITAHSHHCAIGAAPNGKHVCIEGGGFFYKERTEYIQQSTTHHEWTQGFTVFSSSVPTLISPIFGTDRPFR